MAAGKRLRGIHHLTPIEVQKAGEGDHNDGGGLVLRVRGEAASWVFRFTNPAGIRREMGLGVAHRNSLQAAGQSVVNARDAAEQARRRLRDGKDPIDERSRGRAEKKAKEHESKRAAQAERLTLARAARAYHERIVEPNRTAKHAMAWINSMELNIPAEIWHKPISHVTGPELLDAIIRMQARIPETAARVRARLETVFADAEFRGLCSGNPAHAIRRKLKESQNRRKRSEGFRALHYSKAPAFMEQLRKQKGIGARALEFGMLTAARTAEITGAVWGEFDLQARTWTVPADRMKGGEQHLVHLTPRAVEIIESMRELEQPFVFPSPSLDCRPLSNMAMLTLLRRMKVEGETTVHGLCRTAMSTWANETAAARPDVIEACLAHKEEDRIRAAYNRAQFVNERAVLLQAWADYLDGKMPATNVIEFSQQKAA